MKDKSLMNKWLRSYITMGLLKISKAQTQREINKEVEKLNKVSLSTLKKIWEKMGNPEPK